MYAVFTFLAGFSSHKFIAWLDRLADKIFSATLPEQKEDLKNRVQTTATMDRITLRTDVQTPTTTSTQVAPPVIDTPIIESASASEKNPSAEEIQDQTGFANVPMKSIR